ncbi:MAG: ATP-dependent DNA helicase [Firmicutes bacterium]|nr:ATP-dependent DNA helicase [Bacillota bacterium]
MYTYTFEEFREALGKIFTEVLPKHGFPPRAKQIELADEILQAMKHLKIFLAEAEVGIGKTLAYLMAAVLIRRGRINAQRLDITLADGTLKPIVIATSSIALQHAIERDYIPLLSDILMEHGIIKTPLTCVLRKGKGHFLCEQRLGHFYTFADAQTRFTLNPLLDGNLIDLSLAKNLTPYMRRAICVDEHCGKTCPLHGRCRYMRYMDAARRGGYDFQVVNHNYLLADLRHRRQTDKPLIPDYQALIIDEAHKFLDAARSMYGCSLSLTAFERITKDVKDFTFGHGVPTAGIRQETDKILSKSRLLFRLLYQEAPPIETDEEIERFATKIRERTEKVIRGLKDNADALRALLDTRPVMEKYEARRGEVMRALEQSSEALAMFIRHKELVYWLEDSNILKAIPKQLDQLLTRDLWSKDIPIVLTSGTLSAAGSFAHIKRKLGLDLVQPKRILEATKPSPFNYKENALLYISENIPFPDNDDRDYIRAVADEAEKLIRVAHGHTAMLFTSYKVMDKVYALLAARKLPYPMFRQDRGGSAAIERFKRSGNGVLFSSGALWEGIDIPGDILSMLIIVRLPFPVPDPISEWERTLYASMDEYKAKVVVPEMLIKLKQGFGRLIRAVSDTGVIAIIDSRANSSGAYRRRILTALPSCRVTSRIIGVKQFFEKKKPIEFFEKCG